MSIIRRQTREPHAFNPEIGEDVLRSLPGCPQALAPLIRGAAGSSPYLAGLMMREADWLLDAVEDPETCVSSEIAALRGVDADALPGLLRRAKRRVALIAALADLGGAWPLQTVTGTLTTLADVACDVALRASLAEAVRRKKLPASSEMSEADSHGFVVLAMGKMGAGELNYSSDIDLICLFDDAHVDPGRFAEMRQGFAWVTRRFTAMLSEKTADGYVFRTDLRLRPDPSVTPVCISMETAERYYESVGRTWERAAFIKARAAAGNIASGERFLKDLRPFVWRRHLDFAAIQDAHDIRLRIRDSKGTHGPVSVRGHDVKLGRGGIREIELFTQTRQLISGGRDRSLRARETVKGLQSLAEKGWVPDEVSNRLQDHYGALRDVEHRIQMVNDAQTHRVPASDEGVGRVAALMGTTVDDFVSSLERRLNDVHHATEGFFASEPHAVADVPDLEIDDTIMRRWRGYPAFRSERAQRIFENFLPDLTSRLALTAKPDEALAALDGFLAGLPAGVQIFSLFEANPHLIDLLIDIVGTSPDLAGYLSRNAVVFDAVIGGQFFSEWPGTDVLSADLQTTLANEEDYESQLDTARSWAREWRFRIGVHHLRGLITPEEAGAQYASLADAVITGLAPFITGEFSRKYGPPPGRGAAILGMGSMGSGRLSAQSDLDIIMIYDPLDADASDGPKSLSVGAYYARLTQAWITALTAPMAHGKLYEVDMRLRPSGNQGPVATSWRSFQEYQENQAWVWEHLALTRARGISGPADLLADIEAFRTRLLSQPQKRNAVLGDVLEMRIRIASAKKPNSLWDTKTGPGRMLDIELIAQTGILLSDATGRSVPQGLRACVACGLLDAADATELENSYRLMWSVQAGLRLIGGRSYSDGPVGGAAEAFLCRSIGEEDLNVLTTRLATAYSHADAAIAAALSQKDAQT